MGDVATVELPSTSGTPATSPTPGATQAVRQTKADDAAINPEQLRGGVVPVVELRDGCVLVDGVPLLSGLPASMYQANPRRPDQPRGDSAATAAAAATATQQGGVMLGVNFAFEDKSVVAALDDPAAGWRAKGAASLRKVRNCST